MAGLLHRLGHETRHRRQRAVRFSNRQDRAAQGHRQRADADAARSGSRADIHRAQSPADHALRAATHRWRATDQSARSAGDAADELEREPQCHDTRRGVPGPGLRQAHDQRPRHDADRADSARSLQRAVHFSFAGSARVLLSVPLPTGSWSRTRLYVFDLRDRTFAPMETEPLVSLPGHGNRTVHIRSLRAVGFVAARRCAY